MSDLDKDDLALGRLLRDLPRETADDGFAAQVASAAKRRNRRSRAPLAGLLVAAALVATITIALRTDNRPTPPMPATAQAHADLDRLVQEYNRLQAEWKRLDSMRDAARPVVYLGATERTDLVLDLEQLARRSTRMRSSPTNRSAGYQPALDTPGDDRP